MFGTMSEDVRAGKMSCADFMDAESCMSRSAGHCMTMGTASTMACMVEALGMGMPQNAAIPAVDSRRTCWRRRRAGEFRYGSRRCEDVANSYSQGI